MFERRAARAGAQHLILASSSPRRKQILRSAGFAFRCVSPGIDERPPMPLKPLRHARWAAEAKARAVIDRFPDHVILAADTVVALQGRAYGKPRNRAEAREFLRQLSGRTHVVYTAVVVEPGSGRPMKAGFSRTFVTMRQLSPSVIMRYAASGEAQDKAGAYAIQGEGRRLVRAIRGPFDNVVGLPMRLVERLLREAGIEVPAIKQDGADHDRERPRPKAPNRNARRPGGAGAAATRRLRHGEQFAPRHNPELGRGQRR